MAFRVPVPDVSVVDLTVRLKNGVSRGPVKFVEGGGPVKFVEGGGGLVKFVDGGTG